MYPTLTEFFKDIFGWNIPLPVQSYGLFVALGFLMGTWITALELRRKEREGVLQPIIKRVFVGESAKPKELIISALIGFLIGFKLLEAVLNYGELVANPQNFILSMRGNLLGGIAGAGISAFMTYREKQKLKLEKPRWEIQEIPPFQLAGNMLVVAGIFGLLGAKLFHNLEYIDVFMKDPVGELFSFSGLTFLGGFIVGTSSVIIYAKKNNIDVWQMFDIGAVVIPLGYGIGRLGCQVSGDGCWGIPNTAAKPEMLSWLPDWAWSYDYPHNINNVGKSIPDCTWEHCSVLETPVFPTPIYETAIMFIIFIVLWSLRKRIKIPLLLISIYLVLAGLERFLIEKIRVNINYNVSGYEFTQAEIISTIMMFSGTIGIFLVLKNKEKLLKMREKLMRKK